MITLVTKARVLVSGIHAIDDRITVLALSKPVVKALTEIRKIAAGKIMSPSYQSQSCLQKGILLTKAFVEVGKCDEGWTAVDTTRLRYGDDDAASYPFTLAKPGQVGVCWRFDNLRTPLRYETPILTWEEFDWLKDGCIPFSMKCMPETYRVEVNTKLIQHKDKGVR